MILSAGCLRRGMGRSFRSMPARTARVGEAAIEVGDVTAFCKAEIIFGRREYKAVTAVTYRRRDQPPQP
jgi:hypothetical protein